MTVTQIKTPPENHRRSRKGGTTNRPPVWQPQPTGLTRDEIRRIVLEMIG